jgi:hypothetical protein
MTTRDLEALDRVLVEALESSELSYERTAPGSFLVTLPGTHKLKTVTWLVVGAHSLLVEAFFMRQPDENHGQFYQWLLGRNARMYGVAFAADVVGDVYLVGHVSLDAVTPDEIDRLLGQVLETADGCFDPALEIGFASSIRKEWAWRQKRGESTANLQAFARFASPDR